MHIVIKLYSTVFLLLVLSGVLLSQTKLSGKIVDEKTNKPVSFVDISLSSSFTMSNTDGSFYLESTENDTIVDITRDGYEPQSIPLTQRINYNMLIKLTPDAAQEASIELEGTVITGKKKYKNRRENPAWAILREVWNRKKSNGLKAADHYQYTEFEKLAFDLNNLDSAFLSKKIFKGFEFVFEKIDTSEITGKTFLPAFINEAIYHVYGQNNPTTKLRRDLIANKNSGFDNNEIVISTVKSMYNEYNIYDNRLNFFNLNFVSPIARDGFDVYEYELLDTIEVGGVESYRIRYYPKRSGEFTFKGDMYISTKNYAVKEISMETTKDINVNFVRSIFVNLDFDVTDDSIFYPKREYVMLDMSLIDKKSDAKGMYAHRTVLYEDFDFNQPKEPGFYSERYDPYAANAYDRSDEFWAENRPYELTEKEAGVYETLEQLQKIPKFQRIVSLVEVLGSGYINIDNKIDIGNLYSSFGYNDIEGLRLRAGARTYFSQNDMWRIAGYTAYGFKDRQFKYGVEGRLLLNKFNRWQIGIGNKRDIEQMGVQLTSSTGIMSRSFASSSVLMQGGANDKLSHINMTNLYTSIDPWENITFRLDMTYKTIRSADPLKFNINYYKNGFVNTHLSDSYIGLSVIARPGAKFSRYGIDRWEQFTLSPTFMLRYTRGISGLFNADFNYDKLQFYYSQPFLVGSFGRSNVNFEAGKTFGEVPVSLLSVIPGNESFGYVQGTFSQLDYYEFVTDTYAIFTLDQQFNGLILSRIPLIKKLKLREVGFVRMAWGSISDENIAINRSQVEYFAPKDKIYVEYGFGIENIGYGNFRPLRVNFNWRGNYLDMPGARKFGINVGMIFNF